jgi:hypothetical protein
MIRIAKTLLASGLKPSGRPLLIACAIVIGLAQDGLFPSIVGYGQEPVGEPQQAEKLWPEGAEELLPYLSSVPSMIFARSLGVTEVGGLPLDPETRSRAFLPGLTRGLPKFYGANIAANVAIGVHPTKNENEPTVVANPQNELLMVAGSHFSGPPPPTGNRCVAFRSEDAGATWSEPLLMPHLNAASQCSDPVLAYAPDGNRVYYAYMDIKAPSLGGTDIVVSFSNDNGQTWTGPILVLDGVGVGPLQFTFDKPWIGTHVDVPGPQGNNSFVYVTATLFGTSGPPLPDVAISFTRSTNQGLSWGNARLLDVGRGGPPATAIITQGSRPVGGLGGEVLVAWYHSAEDGWGPNLGGGTEFQIRTARSADNGLTFSPLVLAASESFETPFFLGPFGGFQRWWMTMFPDVEIDASGVAHIAYVHDPVPGSLSGEDGDVRYITSGGPPYDLWSSPVTISDDLTAQAQGFPALETVGADAHVIWEDHRLSPFPAVNIFYDVFHTQILGGVVQPNARVTDTSSLGDFFFNGDYFDLTAASSPSQVFGVWTDRRDKIGILDDEDDVWGAGIPIGPMLTTWLPPNRHVRSNNAPR